MTEAEIVTETDAELMTLISASLGDVCQASMVLNL